MVSLKRTEMRILDEIFDMGSGYVLDFSNRTIAEFFEDELGVDIYDEKYAFNGESKAKHVRAFIEIEDGYIVGQLLRKLWDYRNSFGEHSESELERDQKRLFDLIARIEAGKSPPVLNKLTGTADILNFDTVSRDLKRALDNAQTDPESAVTSACSTVESVCRSIIIELGGDLPSRKDIKGLFNAVKKPLGLSPDRTDIDSQIADDVRKILSGLATVVEGIGALRTHGGDAHGRERGYARIDSRIASLSINSASTIALFLIETWQRKFPTKELHKHEE
ncbi:MAG: abortive infection family protein [Candidatus Thiodiazotropha endolucinida]